MEHLNSLPQLSLPQVGQRHAGSQLHLRAPRSLVLLSAFFVFNSCSILSHSLNVFAYFALYSPKNSASPWDVLERSHLCKDCARTQEASLLSCTPMQTTFFGAPAATNGFRDSSFSKNKNLPLHRWVPWVAGFSAEFVEDAIATYLPQKNPDCWVLDPFAGVGTTLVESFLAGLNVVGFEINPYAALATNLKLSALKIPVHDLSHRIAAFERF